jgi:hypothetical protein
MTALKSARAIADLDAGTILATVEIAAPRCAGPRA